MTSDIDLIRLLEGQRDLAKQAFQNEYTPRAAAPEDAPSIRDVAAPVRVLMDEHPDFAEPRSHFFLGKQLGFFNHHQAVNLLRVSLASGGAGALEWYRRVLATKKTQIRIVAEIYGLFVKETLQLSNGVKLLPISNLPDGPVRNVVGIRSGTISDKLFIPYYAARSNC